MVAFHFLYIEILTRKLFKLSQPLWNFGTNSGALSVPFQKVYFSSFLRVSFCGIDKIRTNSASFNRFNEGFEILNLPRLGFAIPYNWPRFTSAERWLINHASFMTNFLRHVQWGICNKKGLLMGNVCSIIFFFASRTVTDWIQEILLPMSFKWWWFLAFSEILLFGVYGVIWYQPIIDAHQLKNGQKPQLLWIYFELHNGAQQGNKIIFYIDPYIFCI